MINEQIRDREVRLIGADGEQLGIVSSREAQKIADEAGLDLVKIAPNAKPPVCKVIDYGKYREMAHMNASKHILDDIAENLSDVAVVEKAPKVEGRSIGMVLAEKR